MAKEIHIRHQAMELEINEICDKLGGCLGFVKTKMAKMLLTTISTCHRQPIGRRTEADGRTP